MFFRKLWDAYEFNTVTLPSLHSMNSMRLELEHLMQVNNIQPQNENRQTRRKKKRRNK